MELGATQSVVVVVSLSCILSAYIIVDDDDDDTTRNVVACVSERQLSTHTCSYICKHTTRVTTERKCAQR